MTDRVRRRGAARPAGSGVSWFVVLSWIVLGICTPSAQVPPLPFDSCPLATLHHSDTLSSGCVHSNLGSRSGHVTQTWPVRELHFSGDSDWSRDGHVISAEPTKAGRLLGERPGGR